MTLDLADLDRFGTVIVTSADVTGRPVGKRVSVDVFRRIVHEGIPLSSCVLGWDVDQWPGPVQEDTGHHTGWHDVRLVPDLGTIRPAAWPPITPARSAGRPASTKTPSSTSAAHSS